MQEKKPERKGDLTNIIATIKDKAAAMAAEIAERAQKEAEEAASKVIKEAEQRAAKIVEDARAEAATLAAQSVKDAEEDAARASENLRAELADPVYDSAVQDLAALPVQQYLTLVVALIRQNAQDGDVVVSAVKDKNRITPELINAVCVKFGLKLTLDPDRRDFAGGVILVRDGQEIDLTFPAVINMIKEETMLDITTVLFK